MHSARQPNQRPCSFLVALLLGTGCRISELLPLRVCDVELCGENGVLNFRTKGSVVFIQKLGSAADLNIHFHVIALDGVYEKNRQAD